MRCDDDRHHHRMDIAVGDHLGNLSVLADGVVHPAVTLGVGPHLFDHLAGVLPETTHRMRNLDLLLRRRAAPRVDRMRHGEAAQPVDLVLRHAEKVQRNRQWNLVQHLFHKIDAAAIDEAINLLPRQTANHLLPCFEVLRDEVFQQRAPAFHVGRFVFVDQRPVHGVAIAFEHLHRLRRGRRDLFQRIARGVQHVVAKHGLYVVIATDDPVTELGAIENRQLVARPPQRVGGVGLVRPLEGVEGGGQLGYWTTTLGMVDGTYALGWLRLSRALDHHDVSSCAVFTNGARRASSSHRLKRLHPILDRTEYVLICTIEHLNADHVAIAHERGCRLALLDRLVGAHFGQAAIAHAAMLDR